MESKRKKVRLTPEDDEEEDRISRLSDDVIHIIMSYLDIKLSVQTCVLSKRWKLVWTTLPFLKFKSYYRSSPKYTYRNQITAKFVAKFLKHRNHQSQISSLKLMLLTPGLHARFLKYAISHRVNYLNVHLRNVAYKLSNFNSNLIQKLKLKIKFEDNVLENCWDLPALTTLHLTRVHYDHSHNLPELCITCFPALRTLCLTDWDLEKSDFSFSLPALTALRLVNCKLPNEDWNFPALKSLTLHDVVFPWNVRWEIFAALVSVQNLTLFFYKTSMRGWVLNFPGLVNLEIRTCYHHKNGVRNGWIDVLAPKLRNFTSVGIFSVHFKKSNLCNVYVKLKGWIDHMNLPREKLKEYHKRLRSMLSSLGSAKILNLELETIEALSSITDYLVRSPSPFCKLKYVKLPLGCKEADICSSLRSYLLGGSPTATIVTPFSQDNVIPNSAPAYGAAQNLVIQESLATPIKVSFDYENIHKTVCIEIVDAGVQEQHVDRDIHVGSPAKGAGSDRVSSSKGNGEIQIWQGHEVNSEFVCLLNLIMNKYPETFENYSTKNKKFCSMELNMLCTSINEFTKISMAEVDTEMIAEYRDVFAELQKYGFSVRWLENRLNYVEQLRFSNPLLPQIRAIDCHIHDAKSRLQDLQIRINDTKNNIQDLQTVRAEKMQENWNVTGTMVANLALGYIGDDLFCV